MGFNCTLLCRLFPSGFPGSELRMLWHSRSFECAISQATWCSEIALNPFNPLKRWGPTKHLRTRAPIGDRPLFHGVFMFRNPWDRTDDFWSVCLFLEPLCTPSPNSPPSLKCRHTKGESVGSKPKGAMRACKHISKLLFTKCLFSHGPKDAKITLHLWRFQFGDYKCFIVSMRAKVQWHEDMVMH